MIDTPQSPDRPEEDDDPRGENIDGAEDRDLGYDLEEEERAYEDAQEDRLRRSLQWRGRRGGVRRLVSTRDPVTGPNPTRA